VPCGRLHGIICPPHTEAGFFVFSTYPRKERNMFTTLIQMTLWLASKWWLWLAVLAFWAMTNIL
jgi:hypothetical protein